MDTICVYQTNFFLVQTHLFASHRYFIYAYETALRNECGYKGYQPVC